MKQHDYATYERLLLLFLIFVFRATRFAVARNVSGGDSPPPSAAVLNPYAQNFNPTMAIVMVVLVSAFFFMGFFSVYFRQCAESRVRQDQDAAGGATSGGGRQSAKWGLDEAVIDTFPSFAYSTVKELKLGTETLECAVCLNEFQDDETLRLIPKCSHVFHVDCVDAWLKTRATCPVCRANLLPAPVDLPPGSVLVSELGGDMVEPVNRPVGDAETNGDEICPNVGGHDGNNDGLSQVPSLGTNLFGSINNSSRPRPQNSRSDGWKLSRFFPRSHSTGHLLVRPEDNHERFTLRLPQEIRAQLMNTHLSRSKSCVAFPRATSSKKGYRGKGTGRGQNHFYYERFDEDGKHDQWGFLMNQPIFFRTGSIRSMKGVGTSEEFNATAPKSLLRSFKASLSRLSHSENNNDENDVGERSFHQLRPGTSQV